jgi:hypothetical protein
VCVVKVSGQRVLCIAVYTCLSVHICVLKHKSKNENTQRLVSASKPGCFNFCKRGKVKEGSLSKRVVVNDCVTSYI